MSLLAAAIVVFFTVAPVVVALRIFTALAHTHTHVRRTLSALPPQH